LGKRLHSELRRRLHKRPYKRLKPLVLGNI